MKEENIIYAGDYEYVPEGNYEAVATHYDRSEFYKRKKLYLWFKIINNKHEGTKIFMPFNLYKKVTRGSKYYEAWVLANKGIRPKANDRMSPKIFLKKVFEINVRTVISGRKQNALSNDERYSIVEEILTICAG
jgi:hypothetical protein